MTEIRTRSGALMNQGIQQLDDGDIGLAIETLKQAADIDTSYYAPWFNLGLAYKRRSQWRDAGKCFYEAHKRLPAELSVERSSSVIWNLGIAASKLCVWPQAAAAWRLLGNEVGTRPDGSPSVPMGLAWVQRGSHAPALGERIDPVRVQVVERRSSETGLHYNDVVVHDASRIGSMPHRGQDLPVFSEL